MGGIVKAARNLEWSVRLYPMYSMFNAGSAPHMSSPPYVRWPARRFARVMLRHRRKVVGTFVIVLAVAVAGVFLAARRYASEARLFIRVGRESVGLDPTATTGQTIVMND